METGDIATSFIFREQHTFTDVPSAQNDIRVTQNGQDIIEPELDYDENSQTLTVSFDTYPVPSGEESVSSVYLTCENGTTATSTQTLRSPKLGDVALNVSQAADGSLLYAVTVNWTPPSFGSAELRLSFMPSQELGSETQTQVFQDPAASFTHTFSVRGDTVPPGEQTAHIELRIAWSACAAIFPSYSYTDIPYNNDFSGASGDSGATDSTDSSGSGESTDSTDSSGSGESTNSADSSGSGESTDSTDSSGSGESTDSTT